MGLELSEKVLLEIIDNLIIVKDEIKKVIKRGKRRQNFSRNI